MSGIFRKLVIGGLFGVAVIIGLLLYSDFDNAGEYLLSFPASLVPGVLALTLFNYCGRWLKWHYYLHVVGARNVSVTDSIIIWVSGFVLALSPGKVAELLKAAALRAIARVPLTVGAPIVLAERITDGLGMLILAAMGFGGMIATSATNSVLIANYLPVYLIVLGAIIAGLVLIQVRPVSLRIIDIASRVPFLAKIARTARPAYEATYSLFRPVPLAVAIGLGVISWMGECVGFYLILQGLGLPPSLLMFWKAVFILACGSVIGGISGLPGGLGAAELSIAGMIQTLIINDHGLVGVATLLIRIFTLWFAAILGISTAIVFNKRLLRREFSPAPSIPMRGAR